MSFGLVIVIAAVGAIPLALGVKAIWTIVKMWKKYCFRGMFKD